MREIYVGPSKLEGRIAPPPSKSIAHRVFIAWTLAANALPDPEELGIEEPISDDLMATLDCLNALLDGTGAVDLNCGESGSTLRFLLPVAAAFGRTCTFRGSGRLAQRPLREYRDILEPHGVKLTFLSEQNLPVRVQGTLRSGHFRVPGGVSSQYLTGLLLALPLLDGESRIELTSPLQSAPYVELTLAVLRQFGIEVSAREQGWVIPGGQSYSLPPTLPIVEPDYSQAAFWLTAGFLGHEVVVEGLNPHSKQGDRAVVEILAELEAASPEQEVRIDAAQIPDLVPILAVAACYRPGRTVIARAERLRWKESDRLRAICQELQNLGGEIGETEDGLIIEGGKPLLGGRAQAHNDHRIAMSLAVAALNTKQGVWIRGAEAVRKSYPGFFQELKRLGGDVRGF